jgi:hypothetical protein
LWKPRRRRYRLLCLPAMPPPPFLTAHELSQVGNPRNQHVGRIM